MKAAGLRKREKEREKGLGRSGLLEGMLGGWKLEAVSTRYVPPSYLLHLTKPHPWVYKGREDSKASRQLCLGDYCDYHYCILGKAGQVEKGGTSLGEKSPADWGSRKKEVRNREELGHLSCHRGYKRSLC